MHCLGVHRSSLKFHCCAMVKPELRPAIAARRCRMGCGDSPWWRAREAFAGFERRSGKSARGRSRERSDFILDRPLANLPRPSHFLLAVAIADQFSMGSKHLEASNSLTASDLSQNDTRCGRSNQNKFPEGSLLPRYFGWRHIS